MKVSKKAMDKAQKKVEEKANIVFCVEQDICPKCSYDLEVVKVNIAPMNCPIYTVRYHECKSLKCDFTYEELV